MNKNNHILFEQLKKEVAQTFLKHHTALSQDYRLWKGADIVRFQEDLLYKVKGRVSEKWFYTYFKNNPDKLPRIDILNLLSEYAGYDSWADFKTQKQSGKSKKQYFGLKRHWLAIIGLVFLFVGLSFLWPAKQSKEVRFCFNQQSFVGEKLKVIWLLPDESEKVLPVNNHCVRFQTVLDTIRLKIQSPYYVDKIIKRQINTSHYKEQIDLQPDLIALLLRHYSNSDTAQWQKRRRWLQQIIAGDAMIFQQLNNNTGVELYDKDDFIDQLCIPTGWLKHMEILEIAYKNNQVIKLRFRIKPNL